MARSVTLSDTIDTTLEGEILGGILKPGQKLRQTDLALRFGVSRMPVRDALMKLEAQGLVTMRPGRVTQVSELDLEEFEEIYGIREVLEELAARLAAPNIEDEDIVLLTDFVEQMEQASRSGDLGLWLRSDFEFHNRCYELCDSPRLQELIAGFWRSTHHYRRAYCMLPGRMDSAEDAHRGMLAALSARDSEMCARLARDHVRESVRSILEVQPRDFTHLAGKSVSKKAGISSREVDE